MQGIILILTIPACFGHIIGKIPCHVESPNKILDDAGLEQEHVHTFTAVGVFVKRNVAVVMGDMHTDGHVVHTCIHIIANRTSLSP